MSPGAVACLRKRDFPALMLQTDILWAAVNGYLRMSLRNKKTIILTKTDPALKKRSRPLAEWVLRRLGDFTLILFKHGEITTIDMLKDKKKKHDREGGEAPVLISTYLLLKDSYAKRLKGLWQRSRLPGILSSILGLGLFYLVMDRGIYHPGLIMDDYYSADMMVIIPGFIIALAMLFGYGFKKSRAVFSGIRRVAGMTLSVLMIFVLAFTLLILVDGDLVFCAGFCASVLIAGWGVSHTCARLSDKGNRLDTMIRGLEMYIRTAEKERLAKINAPEDTLEKYEEILPYAAALGCADAWQKRFEPLLRHLDYAPDWMEDEELETGFNISSYTTIIRTISTPSELTRTINSAAAQYAHATSGFSGISSSSGSDSGYSGGSSGGGSGGGGGGGW